VSDESRVNDQRKLDVMFSDIAEKLLAHIEREVEVLRARLQLGRDEFGTSRQWKNLVVMKHHTKSIQLQIDLANPIPYSYVFTPGLTSPSKRWSGFIYLKMNEQGMPYLATETERFDAIWQASKFLLGPFSEPDFVPPNDFQTAG